MDPIAKTRWRGGRRGDAARGQGRRVRFHRRAPGFLELVDPFAKAEAAVEGEAAIRAPMNGRLVAVAVEEGDTVEAGQRLAVVEAMKMEHALVAPHAGIVRDLNVSVGEQVEMGETIMRVEKAAGRGRTGRKASEG